MKPNTTIRCCWSPQGAFGVSSAKPPCFLAVALVAFLIPIPLSPVSPRLDRRAWAELLMGFQERGVVVLTNHPRCHEPDLEGLYVRGRAEVVVCPKGEPSTTLRHEGWHLVQSLCLTGRTWLVAETVEPQLSRSDRRELDLLVRPERRPREAEARLMARLTPADYLRALDRACAGRLPLGGAAGERSLQWQPVSRLGEIRNCLLPEPAKERVGMNCRKLAATWR